MPYEVQRPHLYESKETFGLNGWLQSVWRWLLGRTKTTVVTSAYTVIEGVYEVRANATSGAYAVTLPVAVGREGRVILVVKTDASANAVTVTCSGSDTIAGSATYTLAEQWDAVEIFSDGISSWDKTSQPVDASLTALGALSGTGLVTKTGTSSYTVRSLTQPAAGITISNSDGVAANPTFALANDLSALEGLGSTGIAVRSASDTWVQRSLTQPAAGLTISNNDGVAANPTFALANDLSALEGLAGTGIAVRSASDTWVQRSLANATAGITWTNADGVSGNPTPVLANDLAALEGLGSTGIAVRSAADTWVQRTLTGPAAGISVSNGNGVSGNPTLALANDLSAVEGLASNGMAARTATDTWAVRTITGTASQISVSNGDGVAGNPTLSLAAGALVSGTYTPTLTAVANVSGTPTAYSCQYIQTGSIVTVSGRADVQPTAATVATQLGISLPIASNLANANECAGSFWAGNAFTGGVILGDATNNRAEANWISGDTTSRPFYFTFTYRVI